MRIELWYFLIQQNWPIFLHDYVTHFEYWLFSKFSDLTARQNKSRPRREYFVYEREEIISFSRLSGKTTEKLFSYERPLTTKRGFEGAAKLYFILYFRVVIILFSTGLYKSAFSAYDFGKTSFSSFYVLVFSCFCIFGFQFLVSLYVLN